MRYGSMLFSLLLLLIALEVRAQGGVELDRGLLSPGEPLRVRVLGACNVTLSGPNLTKVLFSGYSDNLTLELDTSGFPLGLYEVINTCGDFTARAGFTLDELSIAVSSPSPNLIEVRAYSELLKAPVDASITVDGSAYGGPFRATPGLHLIEANYLGLRSSKVIEVPEIIVEKYYTPLDEIEVIVRSQGRPRIEVKSPLNFSEELEVEELNSSYWRASLKLRGPIALGGYEALVSLGNLSFSKGFQLTYFQASYSYDGKVLNLSIRDALSGEAAKGILEARSCFWNRSFSFNGSLVADMGGPLNLVLSEERGLRFELAVAGISSDRELYFPSEEVRICAAGGSFALRSPSGRVLLEGSAEGIERLSYDLVKDVELGSYTLELGNISWTFAVDSYSIEASFNGSYVEGRVRYFAMEPARLTYTLLPSNAAGEVEVRNGSFRAEVPEDQSSVILRCGNAELELGRCVSSLEVAGVTLEANGTCLTAEERGGGVLVTLRSSEGFSTILRASLSEGKEFYVLSEDGRNLILRSRVVDGHQEFLLQDGSPSDPDGEANGLVKLLLLPKGRERPVTEAKVESKPPKVKEVKPKLVKEFTAEGSEGKWRVRVYEVDSPSADSKGLKHVRKHKTAIREELVGRSTALNVSYEVVSEGKISVSVEGKVGWIRVSVKLPRGAVVREVLTEDENGTRALDLWYQEGDELVFYDDPNRYYYVLYGVPPWWDPDGVCRGYDWHYRVPIQIPPMQAHHTIYLDVDFGYLLSLVNVSGTFDPNSVRVVDDQGTLVPKQEFVATGPSRGRVKFVLHKSVANPTNFYLYFDIVENGAKPYSNTLNAGLDSGTLNYWVYGRNPSTIGSIIQASPPGPYTVYDPYGNPNNVTDDGNPVFGSYSLVLGYRTPSGSEDSTTTGEDTWAYYEFTVPSDGGSLEFWYRVESWDSANYDYFTVTLRDTAGNVLATVVPNYNPNPGSQYGNFRDSGWLYASYDLSAYAGRTLRAHFLVHTYTDALYKTWAYVDNLTWSKVDLTSYLNRQMVEGFGVNVTSPRGMLYYGPVRVEARVDARPSSARARIYDPLGNLVATAQLYDDGTNGDAVANDGIYTNANAYLLAPGSPLGKWRVVVLANDSSTSTYSPAYNGLIHIPNRPYEVNYTNFFNVDESVFFFGPLGGMIFEDRFPLASKGVEDDSFANVRVYAFRDDGDNTFDPLNDALLTWGATDTSGGYKVSLLPGRYFLTLNSRDLRAELNPGHLVEETWAEQTYQVEWNGSAYVGTAKFGGLNAAVSDSCSLEIALHDDFETWMGWSDYGLGGVRRSDAMSYNGSYSLEKYTGNDPNGGYKPLGGTIGRGYALQGYAFRPTPIGVRSRVAVALVDANYNGYGFIVDHRNNRVSIVRRTGGGFTTLASVIYDPPDNRWYFWKLILLTNNTLVFRLYDTDGNMLAQVRYTDAAYNSFDRVLVQGDATYYLDALVLWRLPSRCEHLTSVNTANYLGESIDFGFSYEVIVNTRDSDDAPTELRFAQGTLRQFIMNSNAIAKMQKSYFVIPKTDSGYVQESMPQGAIDVWRIKLNSALPQITDSVNLTARTQQGSSSLVAGRYVGCDNHRIPDFETPRVEVIGNGYTVFNLSARYAQLEGFSVYMTPHAVVALGSHNRYLIRDNFIGAYANGTDAPKVFFGVSIGKYGSPVIDRNLSAVVKHNIVARALHYGIVVNSGNLANATLEENWVRGCGTEYSTGDGISLQTNGNLVLHNLVEWNNNNGDTSVIDGGAGIELIVWVKEQSKGLNKVLYNSLLNNRWGVSVLSLYTKANLTGNLVSGNRIGVVVEGSSVANLTRNCIYNNSRVGIDLDTSGSPNGDDVTLNDGLMNPSEPNEGIDYPVITSALLLDGQLQVEGFIGREDAGGSSSFAGALVDVYLVRNSTKGDDLVGNNLSQGGQLPKSYGEGWIYLGRLVADTSGYFSGTLDVSGKGVDPGSLITATATLRGTSEFGPNAPATRRRNLSASIRIEGMEATLNVTAREFKQHNVVIYWKKPENIGIASMSGDYNQWGTIGDVYWWRFNQINAGETKHVYLTFSSSGEYGLLDAFMLGLDPPGGSLSLDVREFSTITFYPDGSYTVSRLWGFLTLNNTSPDPISSLELYLDAPGYAFYLDYPTPSGKPDALPLNYSYLAPFSYVRWRYEAPSSEAMVPLVLRERNLSCGVEVTAIAKDDLRGVRVRKLGEIWEVGDMRKGESKSRSFSAKVSGCVSDIASVEFEYANASLLTKLRKLKGVSNAEIDVDKELVGSTARAKASFGNRASSLIYNLTKICIMRSPEGPVLHCESPNVILRPGEAYETAYFSESVSGIPVYYANATFTIVPSVAGSTVPLQSLASGVHLATASLREVVCCVTTPPAVTPVGTVRPNLTITATATTAATVTALPLTTGPTTPPTETQTAATVTKTPTTTVPSTLKPPIPPINVTIPPEVRELPLPFLMSLGLPLLIALLMMRRRTGLVVLDYRTLKLLHDEGRLQDLARLFRVAITDLTLLRAFSDEGLLRAILSINPHLNPVESTDLDLLSRMAPPGLDLDTLLARRLARRLGADFLPDSLLGRW